MVFLFKTDNEACGISRIADIVTSFLLSFLDSVISFGRSHDYTTNSIMRLFGDTLMLEKLKVVYLSTLLLAQLFPTPYSMPGTSLLRVHIVNQPK